MLPSYASSAHREKMNRHGYGAGANGHSSSGRNNFSIATDKYDKYVSTSGTFGGEGGLPTCREVGYV